MGAAMRRTLLLAAAVAGLIVARAAVAQESAVAARPWFEEVTINGFVSSSYSYNFNRPATGLNAYRVFDFDDNTFKVDAFELVAQHAAVKPRESGFRVDLALGGSVPRVSAASGLFRDPLTGVAQDVDLQQVFGTYVVPMGSGLRVDAGKFITHFGTEVIEGYDGWNDNATRSLLFGYAIPFTHTGVRAAYTFSPRLAGVAMVVNGWDDATDNNTAKSVGVQLALTPVPAFTLYLNGMVGAERPGDDRHLRRLGDLVAMFKASPRVTLGMNADFGQEEGLLSPIRSRPAQWSGAAGYARWQASERFALAARGEVFDDLDGVRTGLSQTLTEITLTPELRVTPRFILRADLRADRSSRKAFPAESSAKDSQVTVLVSAIAAF